MNIKLKKLNKEEVSQITEIDRSDYSDKIYQVEEGKLILQESVFNHPGIKKGNYQAYISDLYTILDNKGIIFGAFDDNRMVGICSIDIKPVGKNKDMLNLGLLWGVKMLE